MPNPADNLSEPVTNFQGERQNLLESLKVYRQHTKYDAIITARTDYADEYVVNVHEGGLKVPASIAGVKAHSVVGLKMYIGERIKIIITDLGQYLIVEYETIRYLKLTENSSGNKLVGNPVDFTGANVDVDEELNIFVTLPPESQVSNLGLLIDEVVAYFAFPGPISYNSILYSGTTLIQPTKLPIPTALHQVLAVVAYSPIGPTYTWAADFVRAVSG